MDDPFYENESIKLDTIPINKRSRCTIDRRSFN